MDQELHSSRSRVIVFFAALVVAAYATSVAAQEYCEEGAYAHAVQVMFDEGCSVTRDNVDVHERDRRGPRLALMKNALSGYWEADRATFEPEKLKLCAPDCSSAIGCALPWKTLGIERDGHRVCAARYVIRCTEPAWRIHVETEPGRGFLYYKSLKRTNRATVTRQGAEMPPFDLCNLAYDEQVETILQLQMKDRLVSISLAPVHVGLFDRSPTFIVNRDELARRFQTGPGINHHLSAEERGRLPELVTFTLIDH